MIAETNITIAGDLKGYLARVDESIPGPTPGAIVLMEAFGLTPHIRHVCDRLAAAGITALAPDIYHGDAFEYNDMQSVMGKLRTLKDDAVMAEIAASLDVLAAQGADAQRIGVTGFCMGGRLAFLAGCELAPRIAAVASFYGGGIAPAGEDALGRPAPIAKAAALAAPVLLAYGGKDDHIRPEEHLRIAGRLGELEKAYTLSVYPQAGHGFCCAERASYHAASAALAYEELIAFFSRYLGPALRA